MDALSEEKRTCGKPSSPFVAAGVGSWTLAARSFAADDRRRSKTAGERTGGVVAGDGHGVIDGEDDDES